MKIPRETDEREPDEREAEEALPAAARVSHREVWVGLFVIVAILCVAAVLLVMTSPALIRGRYVVKTTVPNAGGIRRSDPVQMRGVNIGRVLRFKMVAEGVEIRMEIEGDYDIPVDSYVELKGAGLLGGMVADIVPGSSTQMVHNGGTVQGRTSEAMVDVSNRIAAAVSTSASRWTRVMMYEPRTAGAPALPKTSPSPVASMTTRPTTACRPALVSAITPRTAPSSTRARENHE